MDYLFIFYLFNVVDVFEYLELVVLNFDFELEGETNYLVPICVHEKECA